MGYYLATDKDKIEIAMRHLQQPYTMPIHGKLQDKINNMSIAIKLHHTKMPSNENKENWDKAKAHRPIPTWENVIEVLDEARNALNTYRESPIKY